MAEFNIAAGKGPASAAQAIGAVPKSEESASRAVTGGEGQVGGEAATATPTIPAQAAEAESSGKREEVRGTGGEGSGSMGGAAEHHAAHERRGHEIKGQKGEGATTAGGGGKAVKKKKKEDESGGGIVGAATEVRKSWWWR